jgi:hypothetical protein
MVKHGRRSLLIAVKTRNKFTAKGNLKTDNYNLYTKKGHIESVEQHSGAKLADGCMREARNEEFSMRMGQPLFNADFLVSRLAFLMCALAFCLGWIRTSQFNRFIGVGTTLGWQSYGHAAREIIANSSPKLGWLAPPGARHGPREIRNQSSLIRKINQATGVLRPRPRRRSGPGAGAGLSHIRQIIAINLPLGLLVVVIDASGRYWHAAPCVARGAL